MCARGNSRYHLKPGTDHFRSSFRHFSQWDNVKYHPEDVGMLEENRGKPVVDPLASLRNEGAFGGIVQAPKAPSPTPTPAPKKNAKMAKAAAPSPAPAPEATAKPEL